MERILEGLKKYALPSMFIAVLLILGLFFLLNRPAPQKEKIEPFASRMSKESKSSSPEKTDDDDETLVTVDLKGAVQKPDLYQMPAKSRVADLIKKAGGFLEHADQKSVNLAAKLKDEEVVYVAVKGEEGAMSSVSGNSKTEKVNINTADQAGLQKITGIGAKKAQDIIDYRKEHGKFKSVEELGKVSGFGEKTLAKLKDMIRVD